MIIDFHTHIFSPAVRENRERYFPSEPEFKILYEPAKSKLVGAGTIVDEMDKQGVDKSVVFGFPWRDAETFKRENDYALEAVDRHPDRLIGFCCFDPGNSEAARETERCIKAGISGVGELAFYRSGIDKACRDSLAPVMELCLENNLPVLVHTNEPVGHVYPGKTPNTLSQIYRLARRFPDNKIILAHWGGGIFFYNLLKKEVGESLKNVWFDTAASPFLYDTQIYSFAARVAGVDKILFGSDFPLLKPSRYFSELENTGLPVSDIEKIKGGNAAVILGLPLF